MPLTKNQKAYADIEKVLDTALANGGGTLVLENENQVIRWRQRAYYYRTLLRAENMVTKYDSMSLEADKNRIKISFASALGVFITNAGKSIPIDLSPTNDPLLEEAADLIKQLGVEK